MAQLNQMQMRYVPQEDRILLRLNTTDRNEFRFWLTRRFTRLLWSAVSRLVSADPQVRTTADPLARQTILAFQHEQALRQANFSRPFEETSAQAPLGETPLLLDKIQVKGAADGRQILCLVPARGQGVELALSQNLLHAFLRLLTEAVGKAEWDLNINAQIATAPPSQRVTVN